MGGNDFMKKYSNIANYILIGLSFVMLMLSFVVKDLPANKTFTYENNRIVGHSWRNNYEIFIGVVSLVSVIVILVFLINFVVSKVRNNEAIFKSIVKCIGVILVCFICSVMSEILISDSNWERNPVYYEFSDDKHMIVIEEESFLFYGGGSIYQVFDDGSATELTKFTTDDGGQNKGNYDISWKHDSVTITYKTFVSEDSKATITVELK